ncbi:DUF4202 domain-containing protein [Pseudoalteromonas sp. B193]
MFNKVITLIDEANDQDPNTEQHNGQSFPKEYLYSQRMSDMLTRFKPDADELMQIAVRAQHIQRWKSPRSDFEMNKQGYHQWRSALYIFHASSVVALMQQAGYSEAEQNRVYDAVAKKY